MGLSNIPTRQLTGNKRGRFLKKLRGWVGYFTDIKGKEVIFNLHFIIFFGNDSLPETTTFFILNLW